MQCLVCGFVLQACGSNQSPIDAAAIDAGSIAMDAAGVVVDAGSVGIDAGSAGIDAGSAGIDAGSAGIDAGGTLDAPVAVVDAGPADAAAGVDAPGGDTTAPTVSFVLPAQNATSVATTTAITAAFSENIEPTTVSATTVKLAKTIGGTPVAGTVTMSGASAVIFLPSAALGTSTSYTATVTTGITDLAGNHLATDVSWAFTTSAAADSTPPTMVGRDPAPDATGVPISTEVTATFSEPLQAATVNAGTVTLAPTAGGGAVAGTVSLSGGTVTFTPSASLATTTSYTVTLTTGITDLAGNPLPSAATWSFTTAAMADQTPPTVLSHDPDSGAVGVSFGVTIAATFDEPVLGASVTSSTVTVTPTAGGAAVSGYVSASGATVTFLPLAPLAESTQYTVTLTTGISDTAGNALATDVSWTFTTADTTPPALVSRSPDVDETGVSRSATISATFDEDLDPATVTAGTVTLTVTGGAAVSGYVSATGPTITFTPSAMLANDTSFTVSLGAAITDLAGNPFAGASWSFHTADTVAPTVTDWTPTGTGVGTTTTTITATFSEDVSPASVTATSFTVTAGGAVSGTRSVDGATVTFRLSSDLAASTQYTVTLGTGVTDLAGNPLASAKIWQFTTAAGGDVTPPEVLTTSPLDGATDVAVDTDIVATFTEPVQAPAGTGFYVHDGANYFPGVITPSGNSLVFHPDVDLPPCTVIAADLSTEITDGSGNPLASYDHWSFKTTDGGALSAPTVTATAKTGAVELSWNPVDRATSYTVSVNPTSAWFTTTDTSYTVTGLNNGWGYGFTVTADLLICGLHASSEQVWATPNWGMSWTARTAPDPSIDLLAVARDPSAGNFVRAGGMVGQMMKSSDNGATWTWDLPFVARNPSGDYPTHVNGLAVDSGGLFMALVDGGHIETSIGSGPWWNPHQDWLDASEIYGIVANGPNWFWTVGAQTNIAATGDGGTYWTTFHIEPSGGTDLRAVGNDGYAPIVAVGKGGLIARGIQDDGGYLWWCSSQADWLVYIYPSWYDCDSFDRSPTTPAGFTDDLNGVVHGLQVNEFQRFVAVGNAGKILTSDDDGLTWIARSSGVTDNLYAVTHWENFGFMVVGASGTVLISPNGLSWTKGNSGTVRNLLAVSPAADTSGRFVAVGAHGTILTSP